MLKTCARIECQILYSSSRNGIFCPKCKEIENEAFQVIQEFLSSYPSASVIEIYRQTSIPIDVIETLIKSGRLDIIEVQRCLRCRASLNEKIQHLQLCPLCTQSMRRQFTASNTHPSEGSIPKLKNRKMYGLSISS